MQHNTIVNPNHTLGGPILVWPWHACYLPCMQRWGASTMHAYL